MMAPLPVKIILERSHITIARPSFADLWASWQWLPIRNCSGRFRLTGSERNLPLSALVGDTPIARYRVVAVRDAVLIVHLRDGGPISYERPDGTYAHTLNTPAGFQRKLQELGIATS
jgi:hypothetical protein